MVYNLLYNCNVKVLALKPRIL